jgi:hypothetical protein
VSAFVDADLLDGNCTADVNDLLVVVNNWLTVEETVFASSVSDVGLLMHFAFEPGAELVDSSANALTLTNGGATFETPGAGGTGGAMVCGGTGSVNVTEAAATVLATVQNNITISWWAHGITTPDPVTGKITNSSYYRIYDNVATIYTRGPNGTGSLGSAGGGIGFLAVPLEESAWNGQWNHYALVLDESRGTKSLYLNGVIVGENNGTIVQDGTQATLITIGGGPTYHGKIDEFRIYDRVLDHGEIVTLAGQSSVLQPVVSVADITGDNKVDLLDFAEIARIWLSAEIKWPF